MGVGDLRERQQSPRHRGRRREIAPLHERLPGAGIEHPEITRIEQRAAQGGSGTSGRPRSAVAARREDRHDDRHDWSRPEGPLHLRIQAGFSCLSWRCDEELVPRSIASSDRPLRGAVRRRRSNSSSCLRTVESPRAMWRFLDTDPRASAANAASARSCCDVPKEFPKVGCWRQRFAKPEPVTDADWHANRLSATRLSLDHPPEKADRHVVPGRPCQSAPAARHVPEARRGGHRGACDWAERGKLVIPESAQKRGCSVANGVFDATSTALADVIYLEAFPTSPLILSPFRDPLPDPEGAGAGSEEHLLVVGEPARAGHRAAELDRQRGAPEVVERASATPIRSSTRSTSR